MTAELLAADPSLQHADLMLAPLARLGVSTRPRTDSDVTAIAAALLTLSGLVLVIASLNLANMLLARGIARRKEFAIRLAIGGTRARIVRQLLVEGALLAAMGGALGLVLAQWSTWALATKLSPSIPVAFTFDPSPDARVVAATIGFAVVSVLVFSLGPAWSLARTQALPELKTHAGELAGRSRLAARHLLVGGQLALSLVMLTAAGLFVQSAIASAHRNPGTSLDRGLIAQVDASLAGHNPAETTAIYERLLDQLGSRGDVTAVGLASNFPMSGFSDQRAVRRAGAPNDPAHGHDSELVSVNRAYFQALELRLIGGHAFGADAMRTRTHEAVIDVPLARQLFGDANPIGQSIEYNPNGPSQPATSLEVVGLVPGIGDDSGAGAGTVAHLFLPYGLDPRASVYVLIQTNAPTEAAEAALLPNLQRAFKTAAPDLPTLSLETRAMYRDRGIILALVRTAARIFGAFGLAALLLAAIGVYGVKAYVVSRRTREIGIRLALGATRPSVLWLVTREGLVVAAVSLVAGVGLSIPAGIGLQSVMSDSLSSLPIALVALIVLLVALLAAGLIPARRAMRIQPTTALRAE
jgi:predicted permease